MRRPIEATIETDGEVRLSEPIRLAHPCRAIVIIIEESSATEAALLSESALAADWNRPEEDAAWSHLQQAK